MRGFLNHSTSPLGCFNISEVTSVVPYLNCFRGKSLTVRVLLRNHALSCRELDKEPAIRLTTTVPHAETNVCAEVLAVV
eukprot:6485685-Amphidinium_carterae.2